MPIQIEEVPFGSNKYRALLEMRYEVLRKPLGLEMSAQDTATESNEFHLAAFEDQKLVGCVLLRPIDLKTIKLRQMAVVEARQGRGIGAMIVRYAEQFAAARDFQIIEMHARKSAQPFYEKLGYAPEGEDFVEVRVPHIKMHKQLSGMP